MKKIIYSSTVILILVFLCTLTSFASTSDAIDQQARSEMLKMKYGDLYEAPFVKSQTNYVDESTGSFSYVESDIVIPGKNGLDFSYVRTYDAYRSGGVLEYEYLNNESNVNIGLIYRFYKNGDVNTPVYVFF